MKKIILLIIVLVCFLVGCNDISETELTTELLKEESYDFENSYCDKLISLNTNPRFTKETCLENLPSIIPELTIEMIPSQYVKSIAPLEYEISLKEEAYSNDKLYLYEFSNGNQYVDTLVIFAPGFKGEKPEKINSTKHIINLDSLDEKECLKQEGDYSERCIQFITLLSGDYMLCNEHEMPGKCLEGFANGRGDLRPCLEIESAKNIVLKKDSSYDDLRHSIDDQSQCVLSTIFNEHSSEEGCELVKNNFINPRESNDMCYVELIELTRTEKYCHNIISEEYKKECLSWFN